MQTKPFWQSGTIRSIVVFALSALAQQLHLGNDVASAFTGYVSAVIQTGVPFVLAVVQLVAFVMAIIGRFNAHKTQVTLTAQPSGPLPPGVTHALILALALPFLLLMSGCASDAPAPSPSPAPAPTPSTGPTAMQSWVDANWQIFYYLGYGGAEAYETFGIQHGSTKVQVAQDIVIADQTLGSLQSSTPLTSSTITADIANAGGNVGTKSQTYATLGADLSGPIETLLSFCGGDTKAVIAALSYFAKGAGDYAATLLPPATSSDAPSFRLSQPLYAAAP